MNFAIATFLIIVLLLPGIIFALNLYRDPVTKTALKNNVVTMIVNSIIPAAIIHSLLIWGVKSFSNYQVNFAQVSILIYGKSFGGYSVDQVFSDMQDMFFQLVIYQLLAAGLGFLIGKIASWTVWEFNIDKILGFNIGTPWEYDRSRVRRHDCHMELLCEISGKLVLYSGILEDYRFSNDTVDVIQLRKASRRYVLKKKGKIKNKNKGVYENPYDMNFLLKKAEIRLGEQKDKELKSYNDFEKRVKQRRVYHWSYTEKVKIGNLIVRYETIKNYGIWYGGIKKRTMLGYVWAAKIGLPFDDYKSRLLSMFTENIFRLKPPKQSEN